MSWRDKLLPASFRGIPFGIFTHDSSIGGRRVQVHRYPGRDRHLAEDLGKKPSEFSFEAFVLGDDYIERRDRIIDACSAAGPGSLVHPYFGNVQAVCTGCRIKESTADGRMARLSLTFTDAGANRFPSESRDTAAAIEETATASRQTLLDSFVAAFTVAGQPGFVAAEAAKLIPQAAAAVVAIAASPSTDLIRAADALALRAEELVQSAADLGETLVTHVETAQQAVAPTMTNIALIIEQTDLGPKLPPVVTATATRLIQTRNQISVSGLVRRAGLMEAARTVPTVVLNTQREAYLLRQELADRFDDELNYASDEGDDMAFDALTSLRNAVVQHLSARAPDLARIVTVATQVSEPALVTAYRFYEDANKSDEIVWRNKTPHPGFLPGGSSIDILTVNQADG